MRKKIQVYLRCGRLAVFDLKLELGTPLQVTVTANTHSDNRVHFHICIDFELVTDK